MSIVEVVEYKLVAKMKELLERDLRDALAPDDPTRVDIVTLGKYTSDLENKIVLSVFPDHPLGISGDRVNALAEYRQSRAERYRPGRYPVESIGGVRWRHIFGTVQIRSVQNLNPAEAIPIISLIKTRIAAVINEDADLVGISDDFGYHIFDLETTDDYGYASGGEGAAVDARWIDWLAHCVFRRSRNRPE